MNLRKFLLRYWQVITKNELMALGGQVTFYIILSFFPFLIVILTLAGYLNLSDQQLFRDFQFLVPEESYRIVEKVINEILSSRSPTLLSFGMLGALWASLNGINALMRGISKSYNIEENRSFLRFKLIALIFLIIILLAIFSSFVVLVLGEILGNLIFSYFGGDGLFTYIWNKLRLIILFCFLIVTFVILNLMATGFRYSALLMFPGSLLAAAGWIVISLGFSFYVRHFSNYSLTYGSIGGIIILLLWIYWSSEILLLSCAFNAVLIEFKGKKY